MTRLVALFCLMLFSQYAFSATKLLSCNLGGSPPRIVDVLRGHKIYNTYVYYLRINGSREQPVLGDTEKSRGTHTFLKCLGNDARGLLFVGEFAANYPQGIVISYNSSIGEFERIDFAERNLPAWLYLGARDTMVVIPSGGYGETDKKFVVYRYAAGRGQEEQAGFSDILPRAIGYKVIRVRP